MCEHVISNLDLQNNTEERRRKQRKKKKFCKKSFISQGDTGIWNVRSSLLFSLCIIKGQIQLAFSQHLFPWAPQKLVLWYPISRISHLLKWCLINARWSPAMISELSRHNSWDLVYPVLLLQNDMQIVYHEQSLPVHFADLCPVTLTLDITNLKCIHIWELSS